MGSSGRLRTNIIDLEINAEYFNVSVKLALILITFVSKHPSLLRDFYGTDDVFSSSGSVPKQSEHGIRLQKLFATPATCFN